MCNSEKERLSKRSVVNLFANAAAVEQRKDSLKKRKQQITDLLFLIDANNSFSTFDLLGGVCVL